VAGSAEGAELDRKSIHPSLRVHDRQDSIQLVGECLVIFSQVSGALISAGRN